MNKSYRFLGIDGGGTKTTAIVTDEQGNCLGIAKGPSINYYSIGMEKARNHLRSILDQLSIRYDLQSYDDVCIGMSALNDEADEETTEIFTDGIVNAQHIYMHGDAFIALMGLTMGEPGILMISGTGSVGVALNRERKWLTVGGWGHVLGDQGSGYDIGLKGLKASLTSYEGWGEQTQLVQALQRYFDVKHMPMLLDKVYNPTIEKHIVAGFAKEVAVCAEQGDAISLQILSQAADDLLAQANILLNEVGSDVVPVGVHGGVFQYSSIFYQLFVQKLHNKYPGLRVVKPAYRPEVGAIFQCFNNSRIAISQHVLNNLDKIM